MHPATKFITPHPYSPVTIRFLIHLLPPSTTTTTTATLSLLLPFQLLRLWHKKSSIIVDLAE